MNGEAQKSDGSKQLADGAKPSNKRTITVKFKQVAVLASGHVLALDEKGFLWQSKGTLDDAMWEQVRQPKIDVEINEGDDQSRGFNRRPGAARFGTPPPANKQPGAPTTLSQKLPLGNRT